MNQSHSQAAAKAAAKKREREEYFRLLKGGPAGTLANLPPMVSVPGIARKSPPLR